MSLSETPRDEGEFFEQQESYSQENIRQIAFDISEMERFVGKAQIFSDADSPAAANDALRVLLREYGLPANAPLERRAMRAFHDLLNEAARVFQDVDRGDFDAGAYAAFLAQSLRRPRQNAGCRRSFKKRGLRSLL